MSGIQSGFRFNGKHCMHDYGLLFVEDSGGRAVTHARKINEYQIAGASGTIRFPGEAFETATLSGSLFPLESPADEAAAQALMRQVDAWLYGPRGTLIFDYEPDKYRLAEVTGESKWSYRDWMDGGLEIEFIIQPFAYALFPTSVGGTVTGSAEYDFTVPGTEDAPLLAVITNLGESALTRVQIALGGKSWLFEGLDIAQGGTLSISCEPPIGATVTQGGITESAMPCAARFDLLAGRGALMAAVSLGFEGGSGSAAVRLSARGRWK